MGLFNLIGDVVGQLHDMKELGKIQDDVEAAVENLVKSGKAPQALTTAIEKVKGLSKDASLDESMGTLLNFAKQISSNIDLFDGDIKKTCEHFSKVVTDLEGKTEDFQKLLGKK